VKFSALAVDYDGTAAEEGRIAPEVRTVIGTLRSQGITVVLVTGRIVADLRGLLGDLRLFNAIVAENGAVVLFPESGRTQVLGAAPPAHFLEELNRRGVEFRIGQCVVEAHAEEAGASLGTLRDLRLPLVLAFNRDRLMILPQTVNKANGLREALAALRLSSHNTVAVGDAENDHALLESVELGAAVAWGSEALKSIADEVVPGRGPRDLQPYLTELASHDRLPPKRIGRRALLLGRTKDDRPLALAVRGRNVLIAGEPRTGKSWVAGLLCEQLILHRYSVCILDPEGDYRSLEALPSVILEEYRGGALQLRRLDRLLRYPDLSLVIDLSGLPPDRKREYVRTLLRLVAGVRHEIGLPHRIVLDEAHHFLRGAESFDLLDRTLLGYTFVTYRVSALDSEIRDSAEAVIVTGETDPREIETLKRGSTDNWAELFSTLGLDEAVLLPDAEESGGVPQRFRIASRLTRHVRHREKYLDVPVPESQAFLFRRQDGGWGPRTRTIDEFARAIADATIVDLKGHLERNDLSRWIEDVFADHTLAGRLRELEDQSRILSSPDIQDALVQAIRERYGTVTSPGSGVGTLEQRKGGG
jgi:hypothetical protein